MLHAEGLLVAGKRQILDMHRVADRHVRPGRLQTVHASRGATSDKAMDHPESFQPNVDASIAYVAVSRNKTHAAIYTDSRAKLTDALGIRGGAQVGAIDETMARGKIAAIATTPASIMTAGIAIGSQDSSSAHFQQGNGDRHLTRPLPP